MTPFVKWAGGKRQLLNNISDMMPIKYKRYIEPFVGGGAVLFNFQPQDAIINDCNKALINVYRSIKNSPDELLDNIKRLDKRIIIEEKDFYYEARDLYNTKLKRCEYDISLAALFIFLNKHCFNGLYRVNKNGLFNVPYNNSIRASVDEENIYNISSYIKNIDIRVGDFEEVCKSASKGDFIFLDSPYAPIKDDSFEAYTKEGFSKEDHIRLANVYNALTQKGCYCMLTNHNTEFINSLYSAYNIKAVSVKRMINRDANNRIGEEVIITNY